MNSGITIQPVTMIMNEIHVESCEYQKLMTMGKTNEPQHGYQSNWRIFIKLLMK